jgi:transposase
MYYAGIDIAKHQHEVCVLDSTGNQVLSMPVKNTSTSAQKFVEVISKRLECGRDDIIFCMEATGHYWLAMYQFLTKNGYKVHVINPIQSDAARDLYIRKSKTDRKDAFILADLLRMNQTSETSLASEATIKLQTLSRTRFAFVDQVSNLKQRVLGILDRIFPEYPGFFSDVFIRSSRELLKAYTTPEEIAAADLEELSRFLAEHSRGRLGADRAKRVQQYAKATFGISIAVDTFAFQLRLLMDQIEFIESQIEQIEEAIEVVFAELATKSNLVLPGEKNHVIETIPGIGAITAAAIVGEIGDIHRFPNARKLVAYAGLDATVSQSGNFAGTRNHISKRGSAYLRRTIWLAATSSRRYNPELAAYYEAKKAEGKHSMVATGAVARRLVHMIYAVWTQNRPYEPDHQWQPPTSSN